MRILNITTLETRRLRGDLIEVFKTVKGFDNVKYLDIFHLPTTGFRGHSLKLFKHSFKRNVGKYTLIVGLLIAGIVCRTI